MHYNPYTHEFKVEIDNEFNRPGFLSYIRIYKNATTKELVYEIDARANNSNITYVNKTLIFYIPDFIQWNMTSEYYVTLDEDLSYSNNESDLTARILKSAAVEIFLAELTTVSTTVTTDITTSDTSISSSSNTANALKSSTTLRTLLTGETPATRSAQIGMGLGITLIGIIIIVEIIYFKYFYRGNLQRDNHAA